MRRLPLAVAIAACALVAWEIAVLLPQMPEMMASQYGFDGAARRFMSRDSFGWLMGTVMVLMAAGVVLFGLIRRLPDRMINIPAKDYWLAPERRRATLDDIVATAQWILAAAMVVIAGAGWFGVEANRSVPPRLPTGFFWMMGAYVLVFVLALIHLTRRFRRPKL